MGFLLVDITAQDIGPGTSTLGPLALDSPAVTDTSAGVDGPLFTLFVGFQATGSYLVEVEIEATYTDVLDGTTPIEMRFRHGSPEQTMLTDPGTAADGTVTHTLSGTAVITPGLLESDGEFFWVDFHDTVGNGWGFLRIESGTIRITDKGRFTHGKVGFRG